MSYVNTDLLSYFTLGSTVSIMTCFDELIEGQVMAFDFKTKLLILKSIHEASKLNDVFIVNLEFIKNIDVKNETNGGETNNQDPQSIDLHRLSTRVRNQVEHKRRLVTALKANVSEEAQHLYMWLAKMLQSDQVQWAGPDILVFNDVRIRPPYKPENVEGSAGKQRELEYIRKLVSNRQEQHPSKSSSSSSGSTLSSAGSV